MCFLMLDMTETFIGSSMTDYKCIWITATHALFPFTQPLNNALTWNFCRRRSCLYITIKQLYISALIHPYLLTTVYFHHHKTVSHIHCTLLSLDFYVLLLYRAACIHLIYLYLVSDTRLTGKPQYQRGQVLK